jgi:hypothetical protein
MFRAELLWLAKGPTLKMEGKLAGEWVNQAVCLVTTDVVPKGLIVDLTEVSYIDSTGECLLRWLGSLGAVFAASGVYAPAVCERLGLAPVRKMPVRRHGNNEQSPQLCIPMQVEACPGRHHKEEK